MTSPANRSRQMLLLAGVASICMTAAARAQQAAPAASTPAASPEAQSTITEIVVKATRRSELLKNVPMAVSVTTGDQLQKLDLFNVSDIQQLAAGLQITNDDGRSNAAILRGVAFSPDSGTQPAVDVYFNEVNIDAQTAFTSLYDIDQVDVLRGPQGLLRGRTAPAGAITIATRTPGMVSYGGYLQATATDHQATNLQGALNIPVIADKLAIRIAGVNDQSNLNDVRDVNTGKRSRGATTSGRISIAFTPTSNFKSVLTYQYLNQDNRLYRQVVGTGNAFLPSGPGFPPAVGLVSNGPPADAKDRIGVEDGTPVFRSASNLITSQTDWDLGPVSLSLTAGHQDALLLQTPDGDSTNAIPNYAGYQHDHIAYHINSAELRLLSNGDRFWNYMVGASYYREITPVSVTQPNNQYLTGIFPSPGSFFPFYQSAPVNVRISIPGHTESYSLFASSRFRFTDKLGLEVGARYTDEFYNRQQNYLTVVANGATVLDNFATLAQADADRTHNSLTGGANLTYKVNSDISTYFSWGHSYRPGPAAVGVTAALNSSLVVAKSETSDSFELGLKGNFLDHRLTMNADIFHQRFQNYIGRTVDSINATDNLQGVGVPDSAIQLNWNGNVDSTGVEADIVARPFSNWTAGLNVSYVDAHYVNAKMPCNLYNPDGSVDFNNPQLGVSLCSTNGRIAETPSFHLSANSEYDFKNIAGVQPFIRGLLTYQPDFVSSVAHYHYTDVTLMNLYLGVRSQEKGWEATAFVKNLFNRQVVTSIGDANGQVSSVVGNVIATPPFFVETPGASFNSGYKLAVTTLPREFGVTLSYKF